MKRERVVDYLITSKDIIEKNYIINYLYKKGYKEEICFTKQEILNSNYPISISISGKTIGVIESATICYMMSKNNRVKSFEDVINNI